MGNIAAIDMGVVIMRCAIFDRRNHLFPMQIKRDILRENPEQTEFYFIHELSFYSTEHGGTYHFFQFNILQASQFIESVEFQHICEFLKTVYADESAIEFTAKQLAEFFSNLQHRKQIIDLQEQNTFDQQMSFRMPDINVPQYFQQEATTTLSFA